MPQTEAARAPLLRHLERDVAGESAAVGERHLNRAGGCSGGDRGCDRGAGRIDRERRWRAVECHG